MKIFLGLILCTSLVHSREYHYDAPKIGFHQEEKPQNGPPAYTALPQQSTVIKGNFGQNYEVTMIPSQKIFETRLLGNPQSAGTVAANQNNLQYQNQYTTINSQQQPGVLTNSNTAYYNNNQYSTINPPSQYPGLSSNAVSVPQQPLLNPPAYYPTNGHLPQPVHQYSPRNPQQSSLITGQYAGLNTNSATPNQPLLNPPPQLGLLTSPNPAYYPPNGQFQQPGQQYFSINPQQSSVHTNQYAGLNSNTVAFANAHQHLNQYTNQQQQIHPAGAISIQYHQQQQQYNNNPHNLLSDSVNSNKYVSQSEASQLDVYPYMQSPIGNTRPFTRITTNCYPGMVQCEQQNASNSIDLLHQQVLQQSKAKIEAISDKCRNTGYSQNTQNSQVSLTAEQIAAKRNFASKKIYLKDRRQFAYTEQELPQYPHN